VGGDCADGERAGCGPARSEGDSAAGDQDVDAGHAGKTNIEQHNLRRACFGLRQQGILYRTPGPDAMEARAAVDQRVQPLAGAALVFNDADADG